MYRYYMWLLSVIILFFQVEYTLAYKGSCAHVLEMGKGARPVAMGEAFCSVADDINSIWWNPAGLAWQIERKICVFHENYYQDIRYNEIAGIYPLEDILAGMGLSVGELRMNTLVGMDDKGFKTHEFDVKDSVVTFGIAQILDEGMRLGIGVSVKWVRQEIADYKAATEAYSVGLLYKLPYMTVGVMIENMGKKMKYIKRGYDLPLTFRIGCSKVFWDNKILCAIDVNKPRRDKIYINVGGEYYITDNIVIRMGMSLKPDVDIGISSGIGVMIGDILKFDVAYSSHRELGGISTVSFGVNFGRKDWSWLNEIE